MHLVGTAPTFDTLEMPPLTHAAGDLVVAILFKRQSVKKSFSYLKPLTSGFERP